jgi:hypothetical protein
MGHCLASVPQSPLSTSDRQTPDEQNANSIALLEVDELAAN